MNMTAKAAILVMGFALSAAAHSSSIVYDNSTNLLGFLVVGNDAEWGDGVTLAGTDRIVDRISLLIFSLSEDDVFADTTVRFFDGGDTGPDPGALLWTSATFTQMLFLSQQNTYDFAVPDILVGNEMTWTVELSNVTGDTPDLLGSRFVSPPTVGTSSDFAWNHTGGVWAQTDFGLGADTNNFGAIISAHAAVPEPTTLLLLGLGLAGLGFARRKKLVC